MYQPNYLVSLTGIALWALVPGFIAAHKGRNFAVYYILSFLITPILTTIIVLCLSRIEETNPDEQLDLTKRFICKTCGSYVGRPVDECPKCGSKAKYIDRYQKNAVSVEKRFKCTNCGSEFADRQKSCPACGFTQFIIERPTIPFVSDDEGDTIKNADGTRTLKAPFGMPDNACGETKSALAEKDSDAAPETEEVASGEEKKADKVNEANDKLFCRECGKRLDPDVLFCPECGTQVLRPSLGIEHVIPSNEEERAISQIVSSGEVLPEGNAAVSIGIDHTEATDAPKEGFAIDLSNLSPILRRAFILTEDEEWEKADRYFERVLDGEPENAYAYLGKLMVNKRLHSIDDLKIIEGLSNDKLYCRAIQFADESLKQKLLSLL